MASVNDEYKIPKLGQDNYYAWSVRSKAALIQKNCWEAVDPGYDDDDLTDTQTKANQKALSFILLVVSDVYLDDIGHCVRASEAWSILEDIHSNFGLLHVLILLKEMVNVTKTRDISMQEYMSKIQNLNRKVATGGFDFDDKTLALFFLLGLPLDTYEGLVRNLEADESKLTSKAVKSKLLLEEKRMQKVGSEGATKETENMSESKALATKAKGQNTKKYKTYNQNQNNPGKQENTNTKSRFVICFACGRKGHIARHCDLKNNEEQCTGNKELSKTDETKHADAVVYTHRALCSKKCPTTNSSRWLLDSGATDHMTPHREKLQNYKIEASTVCTANGEQLTVAGQGTVKIELKDEYGGWTFTLTNVLHVPSLEDNLISMSRIEEKGYKQIINDGRVDVFDDQEIIFSAFRKGHLYCVEEKDEIKSAKAVTGNDISLWHRRLGHAHIRSLGEVGGVEKQQTKGEPPDEERQGKDDPPGSDVAADDVCIVCIKGKMRRRSFPNIGSQQTAAPLDLIHSDVVGKISPQSLGKAKYFVTFIDDYSRYMYVRVIHAKSDVLREFDIFRRKVENKHGRKIKVLRSDNGGEYTSRVFADYLHEHGIKHQLTAPYTPQQNGIAERANQTLLGATRCQLIEAGMPNYFWAESLNTACHVRNRCKSVAIGGKIPHEVWTGKNDDLTYLRVFGCRAWAKVMQGSKLSERAIECVFLGYQEGVKGYRLWHLAKTQVIVSTDVIFEENVFPFMLEPLKELVLTTETEKDEVTTDDDDALLIRISVDEGEPTLEENEDEGEERENDCSGEHEDEIIPPTAVTEDVLQGPRRSTRNRKPVDRYCCTAETMFDEIADIPMTPEDALTGREAQEWREAIFGRKEKIDRLIDCLGEKFKIKVFGELTSLLSLSIEKIEEGAMIIHQKQYIKDVLKTFHLDESRGVKTPLVVGEYFTTTPEEEENTETANEALYRKAIGCLLYLSNGSRPDLSFAVCYMSQFCNNARNDHWTAVKHILRYLHQTEERELKYHKCGEPLKVYVDADWASDKNDRRSFSGFTIILAGGAIIWQTRKQRVIALSTVEAEYIAMTEATKEVIWLQGFLSEIKLEQFIQKPTVIFVDNQGAICLAKNRMTSDRSKHIDVKHHFLRDVVRDKKVEFKYVCSQDNLADLFTKILTPGKIEQHCVGLGFV